MLFLTPRYIREAKHYVGGAKKILRYRRDLLRPEQIGELEERIAALKASIKRRDRKGVAAEIQALEKTAVRIAPPPKYPGWRENCEVLLVAIAIAAGVRAYFLQPFKIPTGSMQPTLYGIVGTPTDAAKPNLAVRAFQLVVLGRHWVDLTARERDTVVELRERTYLNFFTFTDIIMERGTYTLFAPRDTLAGHFRVEPGRQYEAGQTIARGTIDTGDQVFVNKMVYHFKPPQLGEVFVFKTTGIRGIRMPPGVQSQHYIKRLAGMPGDTLRIAPPKLYIDGQVPTLPTLQRVMSMQDGYRGYTNGGLPGMPSQFLGSPRETYTIPPHRYFALGDNSHNSSDSRNWGSVPEDNLTGKGFIVYWPFSKRWGWIR